MSKSILKDKSYAFAILIVKLSQSLVSKKKEYVLSKQLLRSGTAVGALIREAEFAQSKADFINKMSISLKEANETLYWLDLLKDTDYVTEETYLIHYNLNKELIAMLVSSIKTTKSRL
ncbi:four helix bundle protein [Polaribacter sp. MSW13]|uniref:Four helix bundle protein n=1 Tax=Polaribacter marinus TaxID=2916838 RepID=A0A9X1VMY3_9FLAO|nr:four helix bundle protein [Polaribacter marinus]MCI2228262.1 four helix bundle protein [Polaribacter marinus]